MKGVCQRGVDCRYSHDLSLIARMARGGAAQPKAGEVCYDYLRYAGNAVSATQLSLAQAVLQNVFPPMASPALS